MMTSNWWQSHSLSGGPLIVRRDDAEGWPTATVRRSPDAVPRTIALREVCGDVACDLRHLEAIPRLHFEATYDAGTTIAPRGDVERRLTALVSAALTGDVPGDVVVRSHRVDDQVVVEVVVGDAAPSGELRLPLTI